MQLRQLLDGDFGPGVYHSNFAAKCVYYADNNGSDDSLFFFVNQVLST